MSKVKVKQIDFASFTPSLPTDPVNISYLENYVDSSMGTVAIASDIVISSSEWISGNTEWYYIINDNDIFTNLQYGVVANLYESGTTLELVNHWAEISGNSYIVKVNAPFNALLTIIGRKDDTLLSGSTSTRIADWQTGTNYFIGDYVRYNNTLYRSLSDHTSTSFSSQQNLWQEVSGIPNWQTGVWYTEGRFVWNSGLYRIQSGHTSGTFATDLSNGLLFEVVGGGSLSGDYLPLSGGTMTGDIAFSGSRELTNGTVSITIDPNYVDISTDGINEGYLQIDRDSTALGWDGVSEYYASSGGTLITVISGISTNSLDISSTLNAITNNGTNNTIIVTDEISNKGIVYAVDYSANFTPESLISKRYADTIVANYLPLSGGTMTGDIIFSGTRELVNGTVSIIIDSNYVDISTDGINEGYLQVDRESASLGWNGTSEFLATSGGTKINTVSGSSLIQIELNNLGLTIPGNGINNGIVITDDVFNKGIVYAGDYSANFTKDSLITKLYADSYIDAAILSAPFLSLSGGTMYTDAVITLTNGLGDELYLEPFGIASTDGTSTSSISPTLLYFSNGTGDTTVYMTGTASSTLYWPSSNGTLALLEDVAGYLPLSGGLMTGTIQFDPAVTNSIWTNSTTSYITNGDQPDITLTGGTVIFQANAPTYATLSLITRKETYTNSLTVRNSSTLNNILISSGRPGFNGIIYGTDFSANYTNRSLVDKEYVDLSITANTANYLPLAGGTMTGDILFNSGTTFGIYNETTSGLYFNSVSPSLSTLSLKTINTELYFADDEPAIFYTDQLYFNIGSSNGLFQGVIYSADYSANYIDRSLVDKAWVDSHLWNVSAITGLQTVLDLKVDITGDTLSGLLHYSSDLTGQTNLTLLHRLYADSRYSQIGHTHLISDITNLQTELDDRLPLTGGTMTGDITFNTGSIENVNYIQFNTAYSAVTQVEGQLHWSDDEKTLTIDTEVTDVRVQLGQENVVRCLNQTGSLIPNGSIVYITGASGSKPLISLASSLSEMSSAGVIGMSTHDIADGTNGYVTTFGLVRGLDTSAYSGGTLLYLATGGTWSNIAPTAPAHAVRIGHIVRSANGDGSILVDIQNGWELNELHDVWYDKNSLINGDIIKWVTANSRWEALQPVFEISSITSLQTELNNKFDKTGGTINGDVTATNFYGSGSGLTLPQLNDYSLIGHIHDISAITGLETELNSKVDITGDTLTGTLLYTSSLTITNAYELTTKQYVDTRPKWSPYILSGTTSYTFNTDYNLLSIRNEPGVNVSVVLPSGMTVGKDFVVKDSLGKMSNRTITITSQAGTIDGQTSIIINAAFVSLTFVWDGIEYIII